jgi:ABC-2 type transport system permease protein
MKLTSSGVDKNILDSIETNINLSTTLLKGKGLEEKSNSEVSTFLGLFAGIMIYMFIFLFGTQVLRGVIEEKTSRIIEVVISSVKPFQLMMGKIIGIALVGLTQFLLWIILTFGIVTMVQSSMSDTFHFSKKENIMFGNSKIMTKDQAAQLNTEKQYKNQEMHEMLTSIGNIDFTVMIFSFIFYFLFGYLLYAALFAAVGSAVDSEADTQQFMLPITIPLIFAIVMSQFVLNNPEGPIAFWLSIIPFTSPIIMLVRIPFGVPISQIILSATLLVGGFVLCTWLAGKIYRTGILMYGKKVSYKELWKWMTYKS